MKLNKKTSVVPMFQCYVIKQMVNAVACTIELWMHLGGLLSTQEARVALSISPRATLTLLSSVLYSFFTNMFKIDKCLRTY